MSFMCVPNNVLIQLNLFIYLKCKTAKVVSAGWREIDLGQSRVVRHT